MFELVVAVLFEFFWNTDISQRF